MSYIKRNCFLWLTLIRISWTNCIFQYAIRFVNYLNIVLRNFIFLLIVSHWPDWSVFIILYWLVVNIWFDNCWLSVFVLRCWFCVWIRLVYDTGLRLLIGWSNLICVLLICRRVLVLGLIWRLITWLVVGNRRLLLIVVEQIWLVDWFESSSWRLLKWCTYWLHVFDFSFFFLTLELHFQFKCLCGLCLHSNSGCCNRVLNILVLLDFILGFVVLLLRLVVLLILNWLVLIYTLTDLVAWLLHAFNNFLDQEYFLIFQNYIIIYHRHWEFKLVIHRYFKVFKEHLSFHFVHEVLLFYLNLSHKTWQPSQSKFNLIKLLN